MAIPEAQLDTWSAIGSITQSATTYETIRKVLNDSTSPYYMKSFAIFLQGSYGNNTNVHRDSDVDIVMCLDQTYYSDTTALPDIAKTNHEANTVAATYGYPEFRKEVIAWLTNHFGSDVIPGKKAIFIKGNGTRRDADVLVCAQHRRYRASSNGADYLYDEGICFWSQGVQIVNFPKQHADNCTTKHQNTKSRFKPMVRVYKNMRNRMLDDGLLQEGVAPSYFIEGMLWNAPENLFSASYSDTFVATFNWILNEDKKKLACANDLFWLVRDGGGNCWLPVNFDTYLAAAKKYWNDWS